MKLLKRFGFVIHFHSSNISLSLMLFGVVFIAFPHRWREFWKLLITLMKLLHYPDILIEATF